MKWKEEKQSWISCFPYEYAKKELVEVSAVCLLLCLSCSLSPIHTCLVGWKATTSEEPEPPEWADRALVLFCSGVERGSHGRRSQLPALQCLAQEKDDRGEGQITASLHQVICIYVIAGMFKWTRIYLSIRLKCVSPRRAWCMTTGSMMQA